MAASYEEWRSGTSTSSCFDCLLPTGIHVPLVADRNITLAVLKAALWKEAQKYPFKELLEDAAEYVFVGITSDAPYRQEFYDESRIIADLRLFMPVLQLQEMEGNREEKKASNDISEVCGISIADFNASTDQENVDYRLSLLNITKEVVQFRDKGGNKALASYFYPSQLENQDTFAKDMKNSLEGDVEIFLLPPVSKRRVSYRVNVSYRDMPFDVVFRCLQLAVRDLSDPTAKHASFFEQNYENYVLKVCGRESYFLQSSPFIQYKYIRNNLAFKRPIKLTLVLRDDLYSALDPTPMRLPIIARRPAPQPNPKNQISTWKTDRKFRVKPTGVMNISGALDKLFIRVGLYLGTEKLCPDLDSTLVAPTNPRWNDWLEFDLSISNIPQKAKLCMAVCTTLPRKRKEKSADPSVAQQAGVSRSASLSRARKEHDYYLALAWANVSMFSARGELLSEQINVGLFPTTRDFDHILNPFGRTGPNTNKENAGHLTVRFDSANLFFPPSTEVQERICAISAAANVRARGGKERQMDALTPEDLNAIKYLAKRDPLYELTEQEKELLWRCRESCSVVPECLPKLLSALRWSSRDEVVELYAVLANWPPVSNLVALELLDCKYPDLEVRKFAVRSLDRGCTDTEVERYLLPLAQILKYEPNLDSPIAEFLLRRGLHNRRIGHLVFWLLRAEMHDSFVMHRFGCILEALCRGSGAYTKALLRQVTAVNKLRDLSIIVLQGEGGIRLVLDQLKAPENVISLQGLSSPLDCDDTLGDLIPGDCKVLGSAKKPLWMVWDNPDPLADLYYTKHEIIFKNGDDLRQDMLTLQVIALMDNIWQTEGLHLRMIPYGCLPTARNLGVIEVVRRAKTVMTIQKQKGGMKATMQVDSSALLKWLKEMNQNTVQLDRAIENFAHSCAGYCVATFILGIGDRHPDNIMVTDSGQMFHIDFGHFLGHFKKKFGITRERVPFVLTADFINVIAKGAENPGKTAEYVKFRQLCCSAYKIMRRNSSLIISLFTMMLSTGIPELQSLDDVAYLRNTLAVDKSEEDALNFFAEKMTEAYYDAWTTKVDWFFHGVKHLNN